MASGSTTRPNSTCPCRSTARPATAPPAMMAARSIRWSTTASQGSASTPPMARSRPRSPTASPPRAARSRSPSTRASATAASASTAARNTRSTSTSSGCGRTATASSTCPRRWAASCASQRALGTASAGTAALFPELQGVPAANAAFTFVGGGAVPANTILFANRFTDRDRPMHDYTAELNLTYNADTGSVAHAFTLGGFYANARARDFNVTTTYLAEFNNQPRLVNLTVTNPATQAQTIISRGGLLNAGGGYVNNYHKAERYARLFRRPDEDRRPLQPRHRRPRRAFQRRHPPRTHVDHGHRRDHAQSVGGVARRHLGQRRLSLRQGLDHRMGGRRRRAVQAHRPGQPVCQRQPRLFLPGNPRRRLSAAPCRYRCQRQPVARHRRATRARSSSRSRAASRSTSRRFDFTASVFYTKLDNRRAVLFLNNGAGGFIEAGQSGRARGPGGSRARSTSS